MFKRIHLILLIALISVSCAGDGKWEKKIEQIDNNFSGNLGVYIKDLSNNKEVEYNSHRLWYMASTIKIPVAIAILQKVEDGEISLDTELTLDKSDLVDGAGALVWQEPGTKYTIRELLIRMLRDSDSVATDMLIRFMGESEFNDHVDDEIINGLEDITTILRVRYEAYGELHEKASTLSNMDIIRLKGVTPLQERLNEFMRMLSIKREDLGVESIPAAFEEYYETNLNSGKLTSIGEMLERLYKGEYLNETHTEFLLETMKGITTGDHRIKAGLPAGTHFAQKTGTQISRACNVGIVFRTDGKPPIIVAASTEKYSGLSEAETTLKLIGELIGEMIE